MRLLDVYHPGARRISGVLATFDIDEVMIERTRHRAAKAGAYNVLYLVRDVFADGFGGEAGSKDARLLFNILHCQKPVRLLAEAARVVRALCRVPKYIGGHGQTRHGEVGHSVPIRARTQRVGVVQPKLAPRRGRNGQAGHSDGKLRAEHY